MNERKTLQDIINSVAEKHGMEKKDAELFVKGVFDLIEESLATENYVKVKGLGTFKLIEVDSRESVDVNTGIRIEIKGHRKVSFQPDAALKELINRPFSHFEIVQLNENTVIEDETEVIDSSSESEEEDSIEINEVEVNSAPLVEVEENKVELPTPEVEQPVLADESTTVEMEMPKSEPSTPVELEETAIVVEEEKVEKPSVIELAEPDKASEEQEQRYETEKVKTKSKNRISLIIVLALLLVGGCIYYFSATDKTPQKNVEPIAPVLVEEESVVDSSQVNTDLNEITVEEADSSLVAPAVKPVVESAPKKEIAIPDSSVSVKYEIVGTETEYTIKPGENLSTVARKFYGITDLWVYLVKHNRDIIKNPDNVPINTTIKIPKLEPIG